MNVGFIGLGARGAEGIEPVESRSRCDRLQPDAFQGQAIDSLPYQLPAGLTWRLQMGCNLALLRIPFISICLAGTVATATAQDTVATIVADQVRSQGFPCKNPSSAERIEAESTPNQTVYLLKCEGMTYHVLLVPDQAADVAKVD